MSKPLFRLQLTAAQVRLLAELLTKVAVSVQDATSMGGLYAQVRAGQKHYGIGEAPPASPPAAPPP